ncbi:MAG TPA: helix-turn-helix transcriptional regulator, partial [Oscillatoriales cyanobacterium M59_W2019_021]|nr:helix-turn-helix transcriptional regulator [Oscillatoriales cyanobacterium M59_W2019_021]
MRVQEILQTWLQQLVDRADLLEVSTGLSIAQNVPSEVLMETKIDGMRYYLVRCPSQPDTDRVRLTPREQAIAQLIAQGLPNKCIAKQLDISPWTVATHIRRLFAKLGVSTRSAMIAKVMS